ncbi:MAG: hypothetical protein ACKOBG_04820 [Actinomycetota bacterium]
MLLDAHRTLGWAAIYANAAAGVWMLVAWRVGTVRGLRWRWWPVIGAEAVMMVQVVLGVLLVSAEDFAPPRFHMFYGFVAFITVGLLYSYRYVWKARGWMELAYGLGGLFLMGLGIRAVLQVTAA